MKKKKNDEAPYLSLLSVIHGERQASEHLECMIKFVKLRVILFGVLHEVYERCFSMTLRYIRLRRTLDQQAISWHALERGDEVIRDSHAVGFFSR